MLRHEQLTNPHMRRGLPVPYVMSCSSIRITKKTHQTTLKSTSLQRRRAPHPPLIPAHPIQNTEPSM